MINTSEIREHMEVISSDCEHVGRIDHVRGEHLELAEFDLGSGLKHHLVPMSWIHHIDEHVHLSLTKEQVHRQWMDGDDQLAHGDDHDELEIPTPEHPRGPWTII